jgi:hypothetical protein
MMGFLGLNLASFKVGGPYKPKLNSPENFQCVTPVPNLIETSSVVSEVKYCGGRAGGGGRHDLGNVHSKFKQECFVYVVH